MPAVSRSQLVLYAALALVVGVLGARALRVDRPAGDAAPEAVVEGVDGAVGAGKAPGGGEAPGGEEAPAVTAGSAPRAGEARTAGHGPRPDGPAPTAPKASDVLVHVAGAVRRPGVYRVPAGARVQDAVTQAGGPRRGADVHRLNLAAKVTDGQQLLVPRRGQAASPTGVVGPSGAASAAAPANGAGSAPGSTGAGPAASGAAQPAAGAPVDLNTATIAELETLDGVGPAIAQKIVDWREANGGFRSVDDLAQVSGIGPKKLEAMRPRVRV